MEKSNFKILLFRYHPYVIAEAHSCPKQDMRCGQKKSLFPPLGLAQLRAVLKEAGYEQVKILDAWAEELSEASFLKTIEEYNPDVVGSTIWTTNLNIELSIIKKVKQRLPKTTVVVGGPHLDVYPRECLERSDFTDIDFGVVGEGEETAIELFDALRTGDDSFDKIKGIVYRDGEKVMFTGPRPPVENLDSLPYPDFSELPIDKYYLELEKTSPFIYIFTARGCPYACRYCFNSRRRGYRTHSVDYVINYIKFLQQNYGVKDIAFWDVTFTFDKERTILLCKRYKEAGIGLSYNVRTRVNHIDEETIIALKESGCYRIHYGVESGTQEILDKMNRKTSLKQIREAIALTKKHGISVGTNFMIGYVDETMETYKNTVKFIKELDPDHVSIYVTTAMPGTYLYSDVLKRGILKSDAWQDYALGKIPDIDLRSLRIPGKDYGIDDLDRMLAQAYRQIYLRPSFILKKLRNMRTLRQFPTYFMQAIRVLVLNFFRSARKGATTST
jgi:radical SAM superfamily enzyme YgiQ (UPF0313 family)